MLPMNRNKLRRGLKRRSKMTRQWKTDTREWWKQTLTLRLHSTIITSLRTAVARVQMISLIALTIWLTLSVERNKAKRTMKGGSTLLARNELFSWWTGTLVLRFTTWMLTSRRPNHFFRIKKSLLRFRKRIGDVEESFGELQHSYSTP